jgi:hypothetical protein
MLDGFGKLMEIIRFILSGNHDLQTCSVKQNLFCREGRCYHIAVVCILLNSWPATSVKLIGPHFEERVIRLTRVVEESMSTCVIRRLCGD